MFITWEKIDQFELKRGRLNRPSLMCRWYGYFCFPSEKDEAVKNQSLKSSLALWWQGVIIFLKMAECPA